MGIKWNKRFFCWWVELGKWQCLTVGTVWAAFAAARLLSYDNNGAFLAAFFIVAILFTVAMFLYIRKCSIIFWNVTVISLLAITLAGRISALADSALAPIVVSLVVFILAALERKPQICWSAAMLSYAGEFTIICIPMTGLLMRWW